jgi:hypothetical protein
MATLEKIETMMRQMLRLQNCEIGKVIAQVFDEKLKIGKNQSVDLPKMERQVNNLYSVVPDAALRTSRPTVVGKGTIAPPL